MPRKKGKGIIDDVKNLGRKAIDKFKNAGHTIVKPMKLFIKPMILLGPLKISWRLMPMLLDMDEMIIHQK